MSEHPPGWRPNFQAILASKTWNEETLPMLEEMRRVTLEKLLASDDPDEIRRLQGAGRAYTDMINAPRLMAAKEAFKAEQARMRAEETDDGPGRVGEVGSRRLARWGNKLRGGAGRSGSGGL